MVQVIGSIGPSRRASTSAEPSHDTVPPSRPTDEHRRSAKPNLLGVQLRSLGRDDPLSRLARIHQTLAGAEPLISDAGELSFVLDLEGESVEVDYEVYQSVLGAIERPLVSIRAALAVRFQLLKQRVSEQEKVDQLHPVAAAVTRALSDVSDQEGQLITALEKYERIARRLDNELRGGELDLAAYDVRHAARAIDLAERVSAAMEGQIDAGATSAVESLASVRTASFLTLGVLSIFASGGAAGGLAAKLGLTQGAIGSLSGFASAEVVVTGAPILAALGAGSFTAAGGGKVDWGKIGKDGLFDVFLARFGGALNQRLFSIIAQRATSLGRIAISRIVAGVVLNQGAVAIQAATDDAYRVLRGKKVSLEEVGQHVLQRLTDPRGALIGAVFAAVGAAVEAKALRAARASSAGSISSKSGAQSGAIAKTLASNPGSKGTDHSLPGFRDTVGWSFDPSVPKSKQPHIAFIEAGRAEMERLVPGAYDKLVSLLTPDPAKVLRLKEIDAKIQALNRTPTRSAREKSMRAKVVLELANDRNRIDRELARAFQRGKDTAVPIMKRLRGRMLASGRDAKTKAARVRLDPSIEPWSRQARFWLERFFSMTGATPPETLHLSARKKRGFYDASTGRAEIKSKPTENLLFHELGHMLEVSNREVLDASFAWRTARAREAHGAVLVAPLTELTPKVGYSPDEVALRDHFVDPYVGKLYSSRVTEVVAVGLEKFVAPAEMAKLFLRDSEHFLLIIGISGKG